MFVQTFASVRSCIPFSLYMVKRRTTNRDMLFRYLFLVLGSSSWNGRILISTEWVWKEFTSSLVPMESVGMRLKASRPTSRVISWIRARTGSFRALGWTVARSAGMLLSSRYLQYRVILAVALKRCQHLTNNSGKIDARMSTLDYGEFKQFLVPLPVLVDPVPLDGEECGFDGQRTPTVQCNGNLGCPLQLQLQLFFNNQLPLHDPPLLSRCGWELRILGQAEIRPLDHPVLEESEWEPFCNDGVGQALIKVLGREARSGDLGPTALYHVCVSSFSCGRPRGHPSG